MKKILWILGLVGIMVGGYYGYQMLYPKPLPKPVTTSSAAPDSVMTFTLEQLAEHSDKTSCWIAIDGKVYDVTPFVASGLHPGKEAILQGCGKDATELFNTRPMGSKTSHSERARKMLPKYLIGELAK